MLGVGVLMGKTNSTTDDGDLRQCSGCKTWKPRNRKFFVGNKSCRYGLTGTCKQCINLFHKNRRKGNEKLAARRRQLYLESEKAVEAKRERKRWAEDPYRKRGQNLRVGMRSRAKELRLPFDSEYFTSMVIAEALRSQPFCECCGKPFVFERQLEGRPCDESPSVDRFIPDKGYVMGNVFYICWRCNNLKRDASVEELEAVVAWMRKIHKLLQ